MEYPSELQMEDEFELESESDNGSSVISCHYEEYTVIRPTSEHDSESDKSSVSEDSSTRDDQNEAEGHFSFEGQSDISDYLEEESEEEVEEEEEIKNVHDIKMENNGENTELDGECEDQMADSPNKVDSEGDINMANTMATHLEEKLEKEGESKMAVGKSKMEIKDLKADELQSSADTDLEDESMSDCERNMAARCESKLENKLIKRDESESYGKSKMDNDDTEKKLESKGENNMVTGLKNTVMTDSEDELESEGESKIVARQPTLGNTESKDEFMSNRGFKRAASHSQIVKTDSEVSARDKYSKMAASEDKLKGSDLEEDSGSDRESIVTGSQANTENMYMVFKGKMHVG